MKEFDDLDIKAVTFDSNMTFEKKVCSVFRTASQTFGFFRKSWRVLHDRSLLWRCFQGFILPLLECCSAVWCSAAVTHLTQLDRVVSGGRFLTGGLFDCDIILIVDLWQYCLCFRRSGVTRCTLFVVLYLCSMCQFGFRLCGTLWFPF